ncbi:MAG: hypothetical protein SFV81_02810 [Pirellulaceae bacterium]|nr:hypothetical protein [Pirellulaceae bacterium]
MSVALATTWEERLADLGNIPANRVRTTPGTATIEDVVRFSQSEGRLYELVLPGWYLNVSELFSRLDRSTETQ